MQDKINITGARTHNLKNINLEIPRNKMVVFTGVSGSGKSSLAFDTIFAEGQRRYVESLSSYARQFLDQMQKPDVDEISGLSPAISIDQKSGSNNPRSTVATITEMYDYLRVMYARVGKPHCLICDRPIERLSSEEIQQVILDKIEEELKTSKEGELNIYAPLVRSRKGEYYQLLYDLLGKGYGQVLVDGEVKSLREKIELAKHKKHDIDVLIDTISLSEYGSDKKFTIERISEAVERSMKEADGLVRFAFRDEVEKVKAEGHADLGILMSSRFTCPYDGYSFPEIEPRLFSFNSPHGACPTCRGLGTKEFRGEELCEVCDGARLRPEPLHVYLYKDGNKEQRMNIADIVALSVEEAYELFADELSFADKEGEVVAPVRREVEDRLSFLLNVGLDYLTLDRRANTLSGGESQRIRLASQLGSKLVGSLYVLDEPTIGLHQRDNQRLIDTLLELRDLGNTIIVVEHDEDTIQASDYLVDIGPGAGVHGGEIVVADEMDKLLSKDSKEESLTLSYLRGEKEIPVPQKRRQNEKGSLKVKGANIFNLENLDVSVPLGRFVSITGVSGSGKSTLMYEVLYKNLKERFSRRGKDEATHNAADITGTEYLARVVMIDQSAIGRTSRSNPATYTGAFDYIRDLFAETKEAKARGWTKSRFSFNVKEAGRCEACQGKGEVAIEMHFLPTVYVPCDVCGGKRYKAETLEIEWNGKNIYEVLSMTVEEATEFFADIPAIHDRMSTLYDVGLGYLKLGQSATTLSGGEGQRVKIASELYRNHTEKTIYLLDEPTVGLHYADVEKLLDILKKLVDKGHTVVTIEHNMDFIKSADYIIDMGPEGGEKGGKIVAKGTPEEVVAVDDSYTGQYLKKYL